MTKLKIEWPTVAALAVVAVALLVAYLAGPALGVPAESHVQLVAWIGGAGAFLLAVLRRLVRRDSDGDGTPDIVDDTPHGSDPPPPTGSTRGGAGLLVLALVLSAATQGCSGPPRAVQHIPGEGASAIDFADEMLASRIAAVSPEYRLQVRAEVARGDVVGVDAEDTHARGMARWEELMAGYTLARVALHVARRGVLSLERVIDAWAASIADSGAFIAAAACVAAALAEVSAALTAADVELPGPLLDAIAFVAPYVSGACPAGQVRS